jgi:putative transposase
MPLDRNAMSMLRGDRSVLRECLSLYVARSITNREVMEQLYDQFLMRGVPEYIRSDNGSEFTARAIRKWLTAHEMKTLYIEVAVRGRMVISNRSTVN